MKSLLEEGFIGVDMPPLPDDIWRGVRLLQLTDATFVSTSSAAIATRSIPDKATITTQGENRRNGIVRWYDPVTGRWLSNDPIGISGGLNQYVFCANNPVNMTDPLGLWGVQFGSVNLGYGDPWLMFDNSSWMEISKGSAATLDGIIPFADPFESAYADECGNVDSAYRTSRHLGAFSRDIYLGARIPNIGKWLKNPVLYETGSATVPTRVFNMIEGLSPTWRGRWLATFGETFGPYGAGEMAAAYGATWNTGFTPGGRLLLELIPFSVTDTLMRSSK